jgi:phytol kinase
MIGFVCALLGTLAILLAGENLRRQRKINRELTRKFVHILTASFAASWPLFLSWHNIELMSLLLFVGVLVSRQLTVFKAVHSARQHIWGELFFAMSIGLAALLSQSELVFAAAMLHLGVADGMAAVVGKLFGTKKQSYKVMGATKTYAGTATFLVLSVLIVVFTVVLHGSHLSFAYAIWLPLLATGLENIGVYGADNLLVPLAVALLLH